MPQSIIEHKGDLYRQLIRLPNILSISRVALLPFVWLFVHIHSKLALTVAALLICIILLTDALDGYIAKRFQLQTKLGMILDHVCDKISTAVILLLMVIYIDFPLWIFLVVLIRDVINLTANCIFTIRNKEVLKPDYIGKSAFALLSVTILLYSLQWISAWHFEKVHDIANILLVIVAILMVISPLHYIRYYRLEWRKYSGMAKSRESLSTEVRNRDEYNEKG